MQISVVNIQELNPEFRLDAEYHRKEVLDKIGILDRHKKASLKNIVDFVIGPFGSTVTTDQYVNESGFRYIRNKDIVNFVIKDSDPVYISREVYNSLPQFHIQQNDLLITVVGTLGKVAIAKEKDTNSIFSCKSTIIRTTKINPYYLLTYLNTNTGNLFSLRGKRGAIQEGLNLSDLKEIQVLLPSKIFQLKIETVIKASFTCTEDSKTLYYKAQDILLTELDLNNWQPKHQLTFVKNFSNTKGAQRIDAEYFQPKHDIIINAIKSYKGGCDTLGNLVDIKKSVEVGSGAYIDEGVPFVRVSNINPFEISNEKYISEDLYSELSAHQPQKGEILFSKDGSPGIAHYINNEPNKMIVSGGILRLRKHSEKVNHEYLTLVLNSLTTQEQVKRDVGGSIILHWRPDQVASTLIPILADKKQQEIKYKISESFQLRKQSKQLLENAKRAVEMAIKEDESTALSWLEKANKNLL